MNCPACNVELRMGDRLGIELDYCPQCRGIWLEKGKLDRILEKSAGGPPQPASPQPERYGERRFGHKDDRGHDYDHEHDHEHGGHGRKRGFFDFFD